MSQRDKCQGLEAGKKLVCPEDTSLRTCSVLRGEMVVVGIRLLTVEVERNQGVQSTIYFESTGFGQKGCRQQEYTRLGCLGKGSPLHYSGLRIPWTL